MYCQSAVKLSAFPAEVFELVGIIIIVIPAIIVVLVIVLIVIAIITRIV